MNSIWSPRVQRFIESQWTSASHRRMHHIGSIAVKVAGIFQLSPDCDVPEAAQKCAALWLLGLESGDEDRYRICDEEAMRIYHEWCQARTLQ